MKKIPMPNDDMGTDIESAIKELAKSHHLGIARVCIGFIVLFFFVAPQLYAEGITGVTGGARRSRGWGRVPFVANALTNRPVWDYVPWF